MAWKYDVYTEPGYDTIASGTVETRCKAMSMVGGAMQAAPHCGISITIKEISDFKWRHETDSGRITPSTNIPF